MRLRPRPSSHPWFLGLDLGTGSCKTVIVDARLQVLGQGKASYPSTANAAGHHEQDPQDLLQGMVAAVRQALARAAVRPSGCAGLSVGGAMHSILALDASGEPLTPVITWADRRATAQAAEVRQMAQAADLYRETGCPVHSTYPLYTLRWLGENEPARWDRATRFLSAKEYVVAQLTGEYVADFGLASGSGLLDIHHLRWNERALALAGIEPRHLSSLAPPERRFPRLRAALAREMGLPSQTPLILGSVDAANSSLGAGAVSGDQATCMVGSSGALRLLAPQPVLGPEGRLWCYAIDGSQWLVGGAINNGGLALSWLRDVLNEPFPPGARLSFDELLQVAEEASPGAGGLLCLPFLAGERSPGWNEDARALFFGLTARHGASHLARALLEGIAFRLRSVADLLADAGLRPRQIRASGGFVRSTFWLQLTSDVLQRELLVPEWGETSALGAAFWAMKASGAVKDVAEMAELVPIDRTVRPSTPAADTYQRLYALYTKLYRMLDDAFEAVSTLQRDLEATVP